MSTPLLVRSTSSCSKGTLSPSDTCQQSASPHFDSPHTSRIPMDADAKPAIDPQSIVSRAGNVDLDQTQEMTAGGRFFNNPYGTVLTTIVELGSTSTLLANANESQLLDRARVDQDAAAVKEFRKIVNSRSSESSSEEAAEAAGGNTGLERQSFEQNLLAEKQLAVESRVLEHNGTGLSDHGSSLLGTPKGPNHGYRAKLGQASTEIRLECSSPKHLFHIFPDYIQLGSVSQHEPPHHVHTRSTETRPRSNSVVAIYSGCQHIGISEASDDTVGTSYLPVGHIPHSPSHEQRRSETRSSASTHTPRWSIDEWASIKHNSSAGKQQHNEGTLDQESYETQLNDILGDYGAVNTSRSTNNRSRSPLRYTAFPPPRQACSAQQNQRRSSVP